ncbi:CRISPR-associated endonuclease Cas3'' [Streptomyces sp. NPDC004609]|uniref:CRISPR-associated endonuclease Cas3'' n=1 Tax=Streptomyces sp. NPDC004609 TaxID=3364704 RepID=UPI003685FD28
MLGKSQGLAQPYPLMGHLLDTAMVAGAVWDAVLTGAQRGAVAAAVGLEIEAAKKVVMFWAGLHDLGKIIPEFQGMLVRERPEHGGFLREAGYAGDRAGGKQAGGLRHEVATNLVLPQLLAGAGYPASGQVARLLVSQVAQVLGGHHGRYPRGVEERDLGNPLLNCPELGNTGWAEQRQEHMDALHRALGCPEVPEGATGAYGTSGRGMPVALAVVVAGLVIVSDWLASQEHVITAQQRSAGADTEVFGTPASLSAHARRAGAMAPGLVSGAGLGRAVFHDRPFEKLFPEIREPYPLQASLQARLPAVVEAGSGPGVLLVTAPPGEGKTEAALYAATVMAAKYGSSGVYFALPTQATANQMYERVARFARRNLLDSAQLTLLHGAAELYEGYAEPAQGNTNTNTQTTNTQTNTEYGVDETEPHVLSGHEGSTPGGISVTASQWLRTRGRGLLAPIAVGTVDQALLGVLPLKRNALRHLGLSGKTVVIDEAHSYDAYTHALLLRLLTWLGAMRVPVVLLSATLTGQTAAGLVEAYLEGAGRRGKGAYELPAPTYPGWLYADAKTVSGPAEPVGSVRSRSLDIAVRPVTHTYDPSVRDGRLATLIEELRGVTGTGGCAAVICTTVAEAQKTYEALREHFGELYGPDWTGWDDRHAEAGEPSGAGKHVENGEHVESGNSGETGEPGNAGEHIGTGDGREPLRLRLLHARFPAWRRAAITAEAESWFGRVGADGVRRPRGGAVLVSTQVIEQSLDFDFDLIVSDLAPMALLLQRSGRVWRHADPAPPRPDWCKGPRLTVLAPVNGDGRLAPPTAWGDVYSPSLLDRTYELLIRQGDVPVEVPAGVQKLVDGVYADEFDSSDPESLMKRDLERLGADMAAEGIASMVMLPKPAVVSALHQLTTSTADEDLISTRLGAETVQLLPVYDRADGTRWLDAECTVPFPARGTLPGGRFGRAEVRRLLSHVVPYAHGPWRKACTTANDVPAAWSEEPRLARLVLLPHSVPENGDGGPTGQRLGNRDLSVGHTLGLVVTKS